MKTLTFIISALLCSYTLRSQNVDNPSFDSVYIGGIDRISDWITSESWYVIGDTVTPFEPDSDYVSIGLQFHELFHSVQLEYNNAFDGPYAIQLLSDTLHVDTSGNSFPGFIVNGNHFHTNAAGYIDLEKCGTPFTYRPDKLRGHYQYEDHSPSLSNYPRAYLLLKKYNPLTQHSDTVGYGMLSIQLSTAINWTLFEMPITYLNNQTPDSVVVAFYAPSLQYQSTFKIDSLGFEYSSTSINETENKQTVSYYIKVNKLYVEDSDKISTIYLFDSSGKQVFKSSAVTEIDLSNINSGTYLLSFKLKNGSQENHKILKGTSNNPSWR